MGTVPRALVMGEPAAMLWIALVLLGTGTCFGRVADLSHEEGYLKPVGTLGKVPILPHAKEQSAQPGLLPYFNIKRMATILGFLGLVNLGLDALPSPKETESLSKKMEVEDNVDTFNKLNKD